jgi:hypothetical protein
MKNEILYKWLGDMNPEDFASIHEIWDYFSNKNLEKMFGEEYDDSDLDDAFEMALKIWEQHHR